MSNDVAIITIRGKEYTVPLESRIEKLLKQIISGSGSGTGTGTGIPSGYNMATDEDIDNLFP